MFFHTIFSLVQLHLHWFLTPFICEFLCDSVLFAVQILLNFCSYFVMGFWLDYGCVLCQCIVLPPPPKKKKKKKIQQ